jgi:hypothetical protein
MGKKKKHNGSIKGTLEDWILFSDLLKLFINRMHELIKLVNKAFTDISERTKKKS